MLTHSVLGPYEDGSFLVVYPTPGCSSVTIASECRTKEQADSEADRLNHQQLMRAKEMRWLRELRGLRGVYPELEGL